MAEKQYPPRKRELVQRTKENFKSNTKPGIWRTPNGDIPMKKMTKEHLINAARFTEQQAKFWDNRVRIFTDKFEEIGAELARRGVDVDEAVRLLNEEYEKRQVEQAQQKN